MTNMQTLTAAVAALSASDRAALLQKLSAARDLEADAKVRRALSGLAMAENHDQIISRLYDEGILKHRAISASAADTKKSRLEHLAAAAERSPTVKSNSVALKGLLHRGHLGLEEVLDAKDVTALDKIFAGSKLDTGQRLAAKSLLRAFKVL